MGPDTVESLYEKMDFGILDFDNTDVLYTDLLDDGSYATITDNDGHMPETLETEIVFSVYDDNDSFQWSVTLEDSLYFQELYTAAESTEALLATLQDIRQEHIELYDIYYMLL
ncbi:MAG: hypothetical protein IPJ92_04915 [Veillonella sp.]|nr:hypothetical protein [Veillonella sp.]